MFRGSVILFTALLTHFVRKHRLHGFQWFAVMACMLSLLLVGFSSVLGSPGDSDRSAWYFQVIGLSLVLVSQVLNAVQTVLEEKLLADVHLPPPVVVGTEGAWGLLFCIVVFIPLAYFLPGFDHGHFEDTYDTFYVLPRHPQLLFASGVNVVAILFLNWSGMVLTGELSGVHRTIFDGLRIVFVWGVSLVIYYGISPEFGEKWTQWSFLELVGLFVLLAAMLIYNGVLRLPCLFSYVEKEEKAAESAAAVCERGGCVMDERLWELDGQFASEELTSSLMSTGPS
jgi:hypothetical protein